MCNDNHEVILGVMIVQSRAYVGIHALSVCALKMTGETPMTLLAASSIFLTIFLVTSRPSVMYEASVLSDPISKCIGWRQYLLLPDH